MTAAARWKVNTEMAGLGQNHQNQGKQKQYWNLTKAYNYETSKGKQLALHSV